MTLKKRLTAAMAAGALLLNTVTPFAFAETTIEISGNGADTDNTAKVSLSNDTKVVQTNNAYVTNNVNVDSDTGGNKANDNGSGSVSIDTGNATAKVDVSNTLNSNTANVDCCEPQDTEVKISDNLRDSDNTVKLEQSNDTGLFQKNNAKVSNNVDVYQDTGDNKANDNIGGSVDIETGSAWADVNVSTTANANSAMVGGGNGNSGHLSAIIRGNGADTENKIKLELDKDLKVVQDNNAVVYNYVYVDQDTGDNKANDNGSDVMIDTGDATAKVDVDNMVNFNWADVDCGCLLDVNAKIAENLEGSENKIKASLSDDREVFQTNFADLWNDVDVDQDTGDNKANDNINGDGDPTIETGNADSQDVNVDNTGNVNAYGSAFELPDSFMDLDVHFSFDLSDLLALLGLMS